MAFRTTRRDGFGGGEWCEVVRVASWVGWYCGGGGGLMVIWMFGFGIDGGFFVGAVEHVTNNEEDHRDERDFLSVSFFERTSKWWHVLLLLVEYYECENSLLDSLFILRYRHCDRDVKINKERVSIYQYGTDNDST